MTENTCWEGLDLIFRKFVDERTLREHKGRSIAVSKTSWAIDGPKLWSFENFSHYVIIR